MKIGIITWWRANYGSILQAYALQNVIKNFDLGECEIVAQYDKNVISLANLLNKIKTIGIIKTAKKGITLFLFQGIKKRNKCWEEFINNNLTISKRSYNDINICDANDEYDVFLCGSDQIWNPYNADLNSIYWLGFVNDEKGKIAYAPSTGITDASNEIKNKIRENLKGFKYISCREKSGTDFLNSLIKNNRCVHVLDPTLAIPKEFWDKLSDTKKDNEPYVFAYFLRGTKEQRSAVSQFAKKRNRKLVSIPFLDSEKLVFSDLTFGDIKYWGPTLEEFISLIRNAESIFTDSYHCSIFSCIYHRPFFVFPKKATAQTERIRDLLELFKLENRMVIDIREIEKMNVICEKEWERVDKIIEEKRRISLEYLKNALENFRRELNGNSM